MTIENKKDGSSLTIIPKGRLDTLAAPEFEEKVMDSIEGISDLVFDLSELEYVASSGLRVFLKAKKAMDEQVTMVIRNVSEPIHDILEVTGFTNMLNIEYN